MKIYYVEGSPSEVAQYLGKVMGLASLDQDRKPRSPAAKAATARRKRKMQKAGKK